VNDQGMATNYMSLGYTLLHLGRYDEARQQGQRSLRLAERTQTDFALAFSYLLLGFLDLAEQAYQSAYQTLSLAETTFNALAQPQEHAVIQLMRGLVAWHLGQSAAAYQLIQQALETACALQPFRMSMYGAVVLALLELAQNPAEAIALYTLASRNGHVANSRWFETVFGQPIAATAATLPPEMVTAARTRGQALDLWAMLEAYLEQISAK
jgi:tetratricopeptide (TPR) repeat protein